MDASGSGASDKESDPDGRCQERRDSFGCGSFASRRVPRIGCPAQASAALLAWFDGLVIPGTTFAPGRRWLISLVGALLSLPSLVLLIAAGPAGAQVYSTMNPSPGVVINATPNSNLTNGQVVTVTGSGFWPGVWGYFLECSQAPNQPTLALGGPDGGIFGVGCTAPSLALSDVVHTDANGSLSTPWTVLTGTIGPPCGPTIVLMTCANPDSAGNNAAVDAPEYPCPPTPAQQAAGVTCALVYMTGLYGWTPQGNEVGAADVSFAGESSPTTTTEAPTSSTAPPRSPSPASNPRPSTAYSSRAAAPTTSTSAAATASGGTPWYWWSLLNLNGGSTSTTVAPPASRALGEARPRPAASSSMILWVLLAVVLASGTTALGWFVLRRRHRPLVDGER